ARRCACAPVFSAAARGASALAPGGAGMLAVSVPQLAEALTPSSRFSFFSTRAAQLAQVIPPTSRSISSRAGTCWESMVIEHSDRLPQRPHHIPLGGMTGRGGAAPPRDRRPRPRPHPPYPSSVELCKDVVLRAPGNAFAELDATSPPDATPRSRPPPRPTPHPARGHDPARRVLLSPRRCRVRRGAATPRASHRPHPAAPPGRSSPRLGA